MEIGRSNVVVSKAIHIPAANATKPHVSVLIRPGYLTSNNHRALRIGEREYLVGKDAYFEDFKLFTSISRNAATFLLTSRP